MENENKKNSRNKRRIFFLIFLVAFTSLIVMVGTYAWFVGTTIAETSTFNIAISSVEWLDLSLDGENWTNTTLTIDKAAIEGTSGTLKAYSDNKNKWADTGLIPVSTSGAVTDDNVGRLKLFTKSSATATAGGYRYKADQLDNSSNEQDGYVAFDLFIRNGTQSTYNSTYSLDNDEAIYLTRTSNVTVTPGGSVNTDYGLANSMRVAFMQVGRVKWDTTPVSNITGINCTDSSTNTQLCTRTNPIIWEPNNLLHNSNLIAYYEDVCKVRTGLDTYQSDNFSYTCETITNGEDANTYTVNQTIPSSVKTDIYDGNNYYSNSYLTNIDTYTDTTKMLKNEYRKPLFYLAPNSITKVRVYIYLEGQDVDNYSLVSNGNTIDITFGFTKDAYGTDTTTGTETATLADYSWSEIKEISSMLVDGTLTYSQMVSTYGIAVGQTKSATINGETHKFRLIDTMHDVDASGNNLGMTFEQVDEMNNTYKMHNSESNSNGWGNSDLKTTINSWTIESDLDEVITAAKKPCVTSVSNSTLTYVTSKLWLISQTEMLNSQSSTYGGVAEGTPYKYYVDNEYQPDFKKIKGYYETFWTRTAQEYVSSGSHVYFYGYLGANLDSSSSLGVSVCFCI